VSQLRLRRQALALLVACVPIAVFLPALLTPLFMDDYLHRAMAGGRWLAPRAPWELYDLYAPAERAAAMARGVLPWWTDPRFSIRFLRPLSSALLWADHRLFGEHPLLFHLHSLAWWALAVLGARALFRRSLTPRAAALATFIFAVAPCHAAPLAWLANREALVALALGTWGISFYLRARREGRAAFTLAAAALLGAAMAAGEYGLCAGGYVVAIEVALRREPDGAARRLGRIAAFALPAVAYLTARRLVGYEAEGSGFYRDPLRHPLLYLAAAPRRLAALFLDGWLDADADLWSTTTHALWLALAVAAGAALIVLVARHALASADRETRAGAWWTLAGSLLSLAPLLAVAPSMRLVGASVLGVAGFTGTVLDRAWFPREAREATTARRAQMGALAAIAFGFLHLVHAPVTAFVIGLSMRGGAIDFARRIDGVRSHVEDPQKDTIVVLRASWPTTLFGPFAIDASGPTPSRYRVLTQTRGHVLVLRDDERTVEIVVPKSESLFPVGPDDLFRSEADRLVAGDVVDVPGMRITVIDADAVGTHRIKCELEAPPADGSLVWLVEKHDGIEAAELPKIGYGAPFDP
jgi:hypothetical protein